jgi:hypothetical protein
MIKSRKMLLLLGVTALLLGAVSSAQAQVVYGQPASGSVRFIYSSWSVESGGADTTLSQVMTPVYGFVPLDENFDLSVYIANSTNNLKTPDGEFDLSGFSDLRMQARHSFANDQLLVAVGMNIPVGKTELSFDEEWLVLQGLSANYFEFPMRRFGEGFGLNVLLGGAMMAGENLKLGGGVSYQFIGQYSPYVSYIDYDPGDVFSFNARGELETGRWQWTADLVYSLYLKDQIEDFDVFRQSPSLSMMLAGNHFSPVVSYGGVLRYIVRGDHTFYNPINDSSLASLKLYGDEFFATGNLSWVFSERWFVVPHANLRLIASNDLEFDNATIFGLGARVGRNFSERFSLEGGLALYTGTMTTKDPFDPDGAGIDSDISGYEVSIGISASAGGGER